MLLIPPVPNSPTDATSQDQRQNFVLRLKALPCQFLHPPVVETYACCRVSNIPGTFLYASSNTHGCQEFPCTYRGASIYLVCCSHSCPIVLTQIFHFSIPACSIRPLQWNEFFVHANPHIKQIGPCSRESLFRFAPPKPGRSGEFRRSIPVEQGGHPHADRAFPVNPGSPRAAGRLTRAQISAH